MTPLAALLAERIRRFGPITFAEYMRECLYHPVHGYYSQPESHRFADYYTSVDVHPIFGRLLARQFAEMWEQLGRPAEFWLVEGAAGTGRLAGYILEFARAKLPEFYHPLRYFAIERSPARCDQMAARLAPHVATGRCQTAIEIPARISAGCVFSNELLDALPVHRVLQQGGALQEIFVVCDGATFAELPMPVSTCAIAEYFASQKITLTESQQAEAGLEACDWITEIGRRLERGFVLSIDYGHEAADLFDAHHMAGTLLAYANHRANEDFYAAPGEQDLTAHVNFTALRLWGQRSGLQTLGLVSQTAFLLALGQGNEFADLYDEGMSESEKMRARLQLKALIYPEGMGERFQVLIQQKATPSAKLTGLGGI
ncbi:MAG TPA: SAM-dependent methyltransferase [Candidatus Sulfotelmatobacter sp.]|nr:SAM-dependent methyltransferase [Candidatus Sulfotelmatobacter sp.]